MAALAFAFAGIACVAQAAAPTAAEPKVWHGILGAVLGGVLAVLVGYAKNRDPKTGEMQKFEIRYAWPTLLIGAIVGLVSHWLKKTPQDLVSSLEASPIYAAVVFLAEAAWKAVWRNSVPLIREALAAIKSGGGNPTNSPSGPS
jgi:hypothetical protein